LIKWLTIILAIAGASLGVWTVLNSQYLPPDPPPAMPPSINPFPHAIAATGLVEAASGDIEIAPAEPGLVMKIHARVGDVVKAGVPLFDLDSRPLLAERLIAVAAVKQASAELERLRSMPRPEDVAPIREAVAIAQAHLDNLNDQYTRRDIAFQASAATEGEMAHIRFQIAGAKAELAKARAELQRIEAGAWSHDIAIAESATQAAQARVDAIDIQIERRTVRAPIDGRILKSMIEEGEYTGAVLAATGEPSMILGDTSRLYIRAQVDEFDIPKLRQDAPAVAIVRGYGDKPINLKMLRIEPYAQPKRQFTGSNIERADTRVLDVIFEIDPDRIQGFYTGQMIDIFISAEQ